jgi:hypothetical protein
MLRPENNLIQFTVPAYSFITSFSSRFLNRHGQPSIVARTALFHKPISNSVDFIGKTLKTMYRDDFPKFEGKFIYNKHKVNVIYIVAPNDQVLAELKNPVNYPNINESIIFKSINILDFSL